MFSSVSFIDGPFRKFLSATAKPCTSSPPSEDCWLCKEVNHWNSALASLWLELIEEEPGRLCLRTSRDTEPYADIYANSVDCNTALLLACLVRQHACIKRLSICHSAFDCRTVSTSEVLELGPGCAVEYIEISGDAARFWTLLLDVVGDVSTLRSLRIEDFVLDDASTSRLVKLIEANRESLRAVSFSAHGAAPEIPVELVCSLRRCEALTELSLFGQPTLNAATALERVMRATESLQKLSVQDNTRDQRILSALCNSLSASFSLTELHFECASLNFGQLLQLLKCNGTLESLILSGDKKRPVSLEKHHGMPLNALLVHNAGLRRLEVRHCTWTSFAAEEVAAGLALNGSLERFDVSQCIVNFGIVLTLCSALETNDTLKILAFPCDDNFVHEQVGLSGKLVAAKCFARVRTTWPDTYTPALTEALKVPALCPEELHLAAFGSYSSSCQRLCKVLANSTIKCLHVKFSTCTVSEAEALREALDANSSIWKLVMEEDSISEGSCVGVVEGLWDNITLTEISLSIHRLDDWILRSLGTVALNRDFLEKLWINCIDVNLSCLDDVCSLGRSLSSNGTLTGFSIFNERRRTECLFAGINHHVDHNRKKWNCAIQFVLEPCVNKRWAIAFESLLEKPCFVQRVARASGKSSKDALRMISSAKCFIARNYFLLTGVVSQGISCHTHLETQIDSLNSFCWLALGKYLRVLDVVDDSYESWC